MEAYLCLIKRRDYIFTFLNLLNTMTINGNQTKILELYRADGTKSRKYYNAEVPNYIEEFGVYHRIFGWFSLPTNKEIITNPNDSFGYAYERHLLWIILRKSLN